MDKETKKAVADTVEVLLVQKARSATKYISENLVVRASRQLFDGKIVSGKPTIIITIGRPNYESRDFVKACKKAKEPFPIKKIQLKFPVKK